MYLSLFMSLPCRLLSPAFLSVLGFRDGCMPSSLRGRDPWKNHPQIRPYDSYKCIIHSHYIIPLRVLVLHHFTLQNTILYTLYTTLDPLHYIIINYICIHIYKLYNKQHVTYVTMCILYALLHNYKYTIV